MTDSSDPTRHQQLERQFIAHVERLLSDDRLRLPTSRGRKHAITLIRDVNHLDRGVELKRLMSEMGKPDRQFESEMPIGKTLDVGLCQKKWWLFKSWVGRFRAISISPTCALHRRPNSRARLRRRSGSNARHAAAAARRSSHNGGHHVHQRLHPRSPRRRRDT